MEKQKNLDNARKDAFRLIKIRARSEHELYTRLKEKGYSQEILDQVIDELKKKGFLDDLKFAKLFASDQIELKFKGPKYIEYELKNFGVKEEIIASVIKEISDSNFKEIFIRFKKAHKNDNEDEIFEKLIKRGFDPYTVKKTLREISNETEV
ncbi:regulatory protein RecX [Athalassotoga saccharophila]|uniref:regulatory protein RecX n=1 Tax=Athalassotoga saccharophila TaxID=1441386 RepID=UPI00137A65C3|nr:regulatory protein RecX [Athalassotoga saccharophila]BBJ27514.1 regulatory protein RecX [Athalassotoga saccharophila]